MIKIAFGTMLGIIFFILLCLAVLTGMYVGTYIYKETKKKRTKNVDIKKWFKSVD